MKKDDILIKLKENAENVREKLNTRRLQLVDADSAKESRFPTGRVELEDEIDMLQKKLVSLEEAVIDINSIKKSDGDAVSVGKNVKVRVLDEEMEFFISNSFADFDLNILSKNAPLVSKIIGCKKGDKKEIESGGYIEVLEIS